MLIRGAEVAGVRCDVRIADGVIADIAPDLVALPGEAVIEARGGALLPGLHDHHIHLDAVAAAMRSVRCGPPEVNDLDALARRLGDAPGDDWLRGVGFHDAIGTVDRDWLDRHGPERPIRIQHRGGRMWIFNSRAMDALGLTEPANGRLIDGDAELHRLLPRRPPDLGAVGLALARRGVTGVTDTTPRNDATDYARYAGAGLPQRLHVMGGAALDRLAPLGRATVGPVKFHFHDHDLPALDSLVAAIRRAREGDRAVAAHCVTRAELGLFLLAVEEAGAHPGDRVEHGGVVPPDFADWIARLGLTVISQPHFLTERGAQYRVEVDRDDLPWLYPLASLRRAGVALAGGSDAPFGGLDPWAAMAAAVDRSPGFGVDEALDPEQALALFTGTADAPGGVHRRVEVGAIADLCLLDRCWATARGDLASVEVRATIVAGELAHSAAPEALTASPSDPR